jgi:hypothetical protein
MKWGVRKDRIRKGRAEREINAEIQRNDKWGKSKKATSNSYAERVIRDEIRSKTGAGRLSDAELSARLKRIKMEKEYEVDKSVVITAAGAANCKLDYSQMETKGEVDMCTVFEETWQEGLNEGLERGIEQGIEQGIGRGRQLEKENLIKLISSMNAGGDTDKVAQLDDPEVLLAMQRKYGMINL